DEWGRDVVKAVRGEGDEQANGAVGISVGVSTGGAKRRERHDKERDAANAELSCGSMSHCMGPACHRYAPRLLVLALRPRASRVRRRPHRPFAPWSRPWRLPI